MVYLGLQWLPVNQLSLILVALLAGRLLIKSPISHLKYPIFFAIALLVIAATTSNELLVKFYPVLMNLGMLAIFGHSLLVPPSIVERLARIREPDLAPEGVAYTRKVTLAWCVFFVLNAAIAAYTALYTELEVWTLYNGLIAYLLMGSLMAIEFCVRIYVRRKH